MAKREVVMCDTAECHSEAEAKCAACEQDVCVGGMGAHGVRLEFGAQLSGSAELDTGLVMCKTCLKSVSLASSAQRQEMVVTLQPLVEFLRSHMAERALGKK